MEFQLVSEFNPTGDQPQAIEEIVNQFSNKDKYVTLKGVTGSGKTFTMANVVSKIQRPTLVLAHNKTLAAQLYSEFKQFFPHNAVEYFVSYYDYYQPEAYVPVSDTFIEKDASLNEHIEQMRLSATKSLTERKDAIVVGTVSAIYGLGDPDEYNDFKVELHEGSEQNLRDLQRKLVSMQYSRNEIDLQRGSFRVRGDTLEIYLPMKNMFPEFNSGEMKLKK